MTTMLVGWALLVATITGDAVRVERVAVFDTWEACREAAFRVAGTCIRMKGA